jgi:hypothetical protein
MLFITTLLGLVAFSMALPKLTKPSRYGPPEHHLYAQLWPGAAARAAPAAPEPELQFGDELVDG